MASGKVLAGPRFVLGRAEAGYPDVLKDIPRPPQAIYGVGNPVSCCWRAPRWVQGGKGADDGER